MRTMRLQSAELRIGKRGSSALTSLTYFTESSTGTTIKRNERSTAMNEKAKPQQKTLRNFSDALWMKVMGIVKGQGQNIGPWLEEAAREKLARGKK